MDSLNLGAKKVLRIDFDHIVSETLLEICCCKLASSCSQISLKG